MDGGEAKLGQVKGSLWKSQGLLPALQLPEKCLQARPDQVEPGAAHVGLPMAQGHADTPEEQSRGSLLMGKFPEGRVESSLPPSLLPFLTPSAYPELRTELANAH